MRKICLSILLLVGLLLSACRVGTNPTDSSTEHVGKKVAVPGGEYTDISVSELQQMLEKKDFTFVNVHIPFEGDIPDTDLSVAYNEIDQYLDELPTEKDAKIVLYCRSDRMSGIASETLVGLGYTNIFNLDGGMVAWEKAGLPLEGK